MKNKLLILLCCIAFIGCKKEETSESVTVNYEVGDRFIYLNELSYFYDDTTALNADSSSYSLDSTYLWVEKDTTINGTACKKVIRTNWLGFVSIDYIAKKSDGNYYIASRSSSGGELSLYPEPELEYPANMNLGTHWGTTPDGKNRRNEVIGNATVSTAAGKFNCVSVKYNIYPDDFIFNVNDQFIVYISNKGLVKLEINSFSTVDYEDKHGKQFSSIKMYRIE